MIENNLIYFLKKEKLLFFLIFLFMVLIIITKPSYEKILNFIDWNTIFFLSGLLIITTSMKNSNYFFYIAEHLSNKIHSKRILSIFLVYMSALLSMILTNDIALFLIIPFTIELKKIVNFDFPRVIILEILSVNIGSSLTPIGNPQNIFLWHYFDISFIEFVVKMMPIVFLQIALITIFSFFMIRDEKLEIHLKEETYNKRKFYFSIFLLITFIIISKTHFLFPFFILIFIYYLIFDKFSIYKTDWNLILVFILFFINFGIISEVEFINFLIEKINLNQNLNLFSFSVLLSQFISNVPATIFISNFSDNWRIISYGVNIGGIGFILGSLANIIGLRLSKIDKGFKEFHKISIPFFLIIFLTIYYILS
ncbi:MULTISPECIES: SLC13 family permease [unclassified Marinitoga]|uniref:SLC13 family permease n=1 Tax=unclassified Marinitoga TaxID=2640159 RepID=UPI000640E530|nr:MULTISPECIES: SLC13 family permease [unclassified Marinitoga]KLO25147.1 hypothetical protein X274_00285 [Marinitoga sp. 1155]NUU98733.1 hypothetical protein [Marinitoga sp. 1154]